MNMSILLKNWLIGIGVVLAVSAPFLILNGRVSAPNHHLPLEAVVVAPKNSFRVRVADTKIEQEHGLSGFRNLSKDEGMLFVFPKSDTYSFWMKDMRFPIDIVWIDENFQVVDRVVAADPMSYPNSFVPKAAAMYVLEIPAGSADRADLSIGASVKILAK